jgi:glycosyltransferase involved in cell wall biosynthesis
MDVNNLWQYVFDNNFISNITVVIKTFLRPHCLDNVISSWLNQYGDIKIIIIDDSPNIVNHAYNEYKNIMYIYIPKYIGLSYGRNIGMDLAKTEYVFLSDDDNLPPDPNILENMYRIISTSDIDILGSVAHTIYKNNLHLECLAMNNVENIQKCDATLNHFLCKKNNIPQWDNNIHIHCEHIDFFLSCLEKKVNVYAYKPLVVHTIKQQCQKHSLYNQYRFKSHIPYRKYLLKKWDLNSMESWGKTNNEISRRT